MERDEENPSIYETYGNRINKPFQNKVNMESEVESQRASVHKNLITVDRPDSLKFVDLHVYVMPSKVWRKRQNLVENELMQQAVSAGFVHVPEDLPICELRQYINDLCADEDNFPKEFHYLRSVGRCLTKVKYIQEQELKVKHYRPPMTLAPEIYILETHRNRDPSRIEYEQNLSSMSGQLTSSQFWTKSINDLSSSYQLSNLNDHEKQSLTMNPKFSKNLIKLREEQKRLYLQQQNLAGKRYELEDRNRKEKAVIKIQAAYRSYRARRDRKQQEDCRDDTTDHESVEQERPQSICENYLEEKQLPKILKPPTRLKQLKSKHTELETDREILSHRLKQLNTEISLRKREEKELWRKKYFMEKSKPAPLIRRYYIHSGYSSDTQIQLERAAVRLNEATKLRQHAEYESRLLRQELQKISSNLNKLGRFRLPNESHKSKRMAPFSFHFTLRY